MDKILSGKKIIAAKIGISEDTLDEWEKRKPLPRIGPQRGQIRVFEEELKAWLRDLYLEACPPSGH